jgi:hypothetical protein
MQKVYSKMPLPSSRVGNKDGGENAASIMCGVPEEFVCMSNNIMGLVPLPIAPPLHKKKTLCGIASRG